ncbi:MAG: tape measure protein, partial [Candidatus Nanopelagicaceae bacterium]
MAAASSVTKELNVPQDVAIQGMTRLTAAVKGAGGGVADAELAFKSINSAIIATGGGAEQVEGAVTALVQIFSKGKVSAEEINQIAERLPGTFNKIAAASGRTGPELTKALQDGKVGLNDLMKFLVQLGGDYNALAEKIAQSSESAGARLQVAYDKMRQEVGKALQPIGAEFQSIFANFIEEITPMMVAVLPKIGEAALALAKNLDVLAISAGTAFAAMGVAKIAAIGGLSAALLKLAAAAGTASGALKGTAAAALLNPWVALATGIAAASVGIYKYYQGQKELNALLDDGVGSTQVMKDKILEYEDSIRKATARLKGINGEQKATGRDAKRLKGEIRELRGELERLKGTYKIRIEYEQKGYKFGEGGVMEEFTVGGIVYGGPKGARARALRRADGQPLDGVTDFKGPTVDTADSEGKQIEQQLARIQLQEEEIERSKVLFAVNEEIKNTARQIVLAQSNGNMQKAYGLQQDQKSLEFIKRDLEIQLNYQKAVDAANLEKDAAVRAAKLRLAESQRLFGVEENINSTFSDRIDLIQQNTLAIKDQAKALGDARFGLREQLGMVDPKERVARAQEEFRKQYPGATAEDLDLIRQQIDPTTFEKVQQNISKLKVELKELVNSANQITGAATAIGNAFSQS